MASEPQHETWVEVDLAAIENNVRMAARGSRARIMAVLKANAYGHGALPVARAALRAGAAWCGVARLDEALELRRAGLDCPIPVLGPVPAGPLPPAAPSPASSPPPMAPSIPRPLPRWAPRPRSRLLPPTNCASWAPA